MLKDKQLLASNPTDKQLLSEGRKEKQAITRNQRWHGKATGKERMKDF